MPKPGKSGAKHGLDEKAMDEALELDLAADRRHFAASVFEPSRRPDTPPPSHMRFCVSTSCRHHRTRFDSFSTIDSVEGPGDAWKRQLGECSGSGSHLRSGNVVCVSEAHGETVEETDHESAVEAVKKEPEQSTEKASRKRMADPEEVAASPPSLGERLKAFFECCRKPSKDMSNETKEELKHSVENLVLGLSDLEEKVSRIRIWEDGRKMTTVYNADPNADSDEDEEPEFGDVCYEPVWESEEDAENRPEMAFDYGNGLPPNHSARE
ncbi:unnamed protein product, partial [Mesorhabditis spiculigera]